MINLYEKFENYVPVATYIKKRVNENFLIVMSEKTEIFYLNDTAHFIYKNIDGISPISILFAKLKQEYDLSSVCEEEVKKDLIELIRDFQWEGLIRLKEVK